MSDCKQLLSDIPTNKPGNLVLVPVASLYNVSCHRLHYVMNQVEKFSYLIIFLVRCFYMRLWRLIFALFAEMR